MKTKTELIFDITRAGWQVMIRYRENFARSDFIDYQVCIWKEWENRYDTVGSFNKEILAQAKIDLLDNVILRDLRELMFQKGIAK